MSSSSHHRHDHEAEGAGAMWDLHACSSISSSAWAPPILLFNNTTCSNYHHQHLNPNTANSANSCEDEDVSTVESSSFLDTATCSNHLLPHHIPLDTHLWSHMLFGNSNGDEFQNEQHRDVGENMVEPAAACDYLKKFDNNNNCWDIMDVHEKDLLCSNDRRTAMANKHRHELLSSTPQDPNTTYNKDNATGPTNLHTAGPCRRDNFADHHAADHKLLTRYYSRSSSSSLVNDSNIADVISFGSWLSKPLLGVDQASRHHFESTNINGGKNTTSQGLRNSSPASQAKGRGSAARNEGKRKRSDRESCSEMSGMKKQKHTQKQSSTIVVSTSSKVAKVKLGDRIGNLQQIVSPFGKTDTASVLMEAIQYIKLLQEQVQLLVSNQYLKTNSYKQQDAWDRKDVKLDLTSRGFCLIPVSRAPQVCRENSTGSDYWTPPYVQRDVLPMIP